MKNFKSEAEDLWERLKNHQNLLDESSLIEMIEQSLMMVVQDYVAEQNFKDIKLVAGDREAELTVLLQKAAEHAETCDAYLESAFLATCELERKTSEDRYIAAKLNLVDVGNSARILDKQIAFVMKQLNLEKE